jgi:outer membrane protein assembly factor BamE
MMRRHYPLAPGSSPAIDIRATHAMQHSAQFSAARRSLLALLLFATLLGAAGCVYRINIQQGNFLDAKAVDQVVPGMARSQVRFLLGTPMVSSPFDSDRWDYVLYIKRGRIEKPEQRKVTVFFEGDQVTRVEREADASVAKADAPQTPVTPAAEATQEQEKKDN